MSGNISVNWDEFSANTCNSIKKLRTSNDFADVTLACEDGEQVEVHKLILAAASPVFKNLLLKNSHPHPIIFMRGVSLSAMDAIVDFLYFGEAEMDSEDLDPFLAIAQELKLEGLLKQPGDEIKTEIHPKPKPRTMHQTRKEFHIDQRVEKEKLTAASKAELLSNYIQLEPLTEQATQVEEDIFHTENEKLSESVQFSGDEEQLDKTVKSMMQRNKSKDSIGLWRHVYVCNICGKEGQQTTIKCHIEARHLEGIMIPCNMCEKIFKSRPNLRAHKRNNHSGSD